MTNDPSWDEIFTSQPSSAAAQPTAEPLTRRQLREAEGRERERPEQEPVAQGGGKPPKRGRGGGGEFRWPPRSGRP